MYTYGEFEIFGEGPFSLGASHEVRMEDTLAYWVMSYAGLSS